MSLMETIKDLKEQLKEVDKEPDDKEVELDEETPAVDGEGVPEEGGPAEEAPKEEPKKEEKEEDASGYARLRRDKLAAEKKARELAEEVERLKAKKVEDEPEVANREVEKELTSLIQDHKIRKATEEFAFMEAEFARNVPEYEHVSNQYKQALYHSKRVQNPTATHAELLKETHEALLYKASSYLNKGLDPFQEMYEEAKMLGLDKIPQQREAEQEEKPAKRPDLDKLAKNKERNAGMAGAKGAGGKGPLTREMAATDFTVAEWAKLPASEKQRLMRGG